MGERVGSTPNTTKKCRIYGQGAGVGGVSGQKITKRTPLEGGRQPGETQLTGVLLKAGQPSPGAWWKMKNQIPLGGESDAEDGGFWQE